MHKERLFNGVKGLELFKLYVFLLLGFLFLLSITTSAITIPYGESGKIVYNLKTGTFNVSESAKQLLLKGFSQAEYQKKLVSSKDYKNITYSKKVIHDGFGNGFKHIFLLKQPGLPAMQQVFYTYNGKNYFIINLVLIGADLSINHIVPLNGKLINQEYATLPELV